MMIVREADRQDVPGIFHVRVSVRENLLSEEQLRQRGITPESVAIRLEGHCKRWVAEEDGQVRIQHRRLRSPIHLGTLRLA